MLDLFGNPQCTRGWEMRCANAQCPECICNCGGANHGIKNHDYSKKDEAIISVRNKQNMFYLTKKKKVADIKVGDLVMVLADFSGIEAGTKGLISENYKTGVMVEWQGLNTPSHQRPKADGFGEDELEYLAFATEKHPTKAGK